MVSASFVVHLDQSMMNLALTISSREQGIGNKGSGVVLSNCPLDRHHLSAL
jgi:hypothetical protein